jgi:hypothetical protein
VDADVVIFLTKCRAIAGNVHDDPSDRPKQGQQAAPTLQTKAPKYELRRADSMNGVRLVKKI